MFFREAHHFEHLRTHVAAGFTQTTVRRSSARLRIWSAGCSTGEEPYTIAAVLKREIPDIHRYDARILATDIDTEVIAKGVRGAPRDVMVAESVAKNRIGSAYGLIQSMDSAGAIAGPLAALVLVSRWGIRSVFWQCGQRA